MIVESPAARRRTSGAGLVVGSDILNAQYLNTQY
jgi:hypothetical protein